MAVIGLKYLAIAPLTAAVDGSVPTYGAGHKIGHLMRANLSWNRGDVKLYGDNILVERDNAISDGTLTIGTTYLNPTYRQDLFNEPAFGTASGDAPQEYANEDGASPYVGVGYVTKDSADGGAPQYTAFWYWKVQFSMNENNETRGENTAFQTPELEGTILGVVPAADQKVRFRKYATFSTEAAAIAWVKNEAGITG